MSSDNYEKAFDDFLLSGKKSKEEMRKLWEDLSRTGGTINLKKDVYSSSIVRAVDDLANSYEFYRDQYADCLSELESLRSQKGKIRDDWIFIGISMILIFAIGVYLGLSWEQVAG